MRITEFIKDRQEQLVKSAITQDEARHQDEGTPRVFDRDARQHLQKANHILLNEKAYEDNLVQDLVCMVKSSDPEAPRFTKELADFWDRAVLAEKMLAKCGVRDIRDSRWFKHESQRLAKMMEKEGCDELAKIMVTGGSAGTGTEWVPTGFTADYWNYIDSKGKIANLFRQTPMPQNPFDPPYVGGRITVFKGPQASENFPQTATSAIPQTSLTTGKFRLEAMKLCAMIPLTDEWQEDSVVAVMPAIKEDCGKAVALARDSAILNGDTSTPHMDVDVTASTDVRKAYAGLRWYAKQRGAVIDLSTFNIANLRKIVAKMGRYGENLGDLFWISGVKTRALLLGLMVNITNAPQYVTIEKNPNAEPLIFIDMMPAMVTSQQREDLNSTGVYEYTVHGYGTILAVNKTCFTLGVRRELETELWRDPRTQTWFLIIWERKAFNTPYSDTTNDNACAWGGNFQP